VIPEMAADVSTSVVALRVTEDEGLLLNTANADVEGLVPSVILVKAVSATIQDSEGSVFATLAVLDAEGDELLDSAGAVVLVATGAVVARIPVVIDRAGACERVPTAVADVDDDASLLKTIADGVGETVPVILDVLDHDNTRVAAARVEESDVLRLEDAADGIVEVLVPLVVPVNGNSVTVEGSGVPEFAARAAPVVLDVEGDELLDPAGAEVWAGTGVVDAMIPVLLDHVDASTLVPIAVAKDDASALKTCVNGVGGAVPVIPEMAADVNTSVVDSLVAENEVLLFELAANADVEGLVPSAVLVIAVSATVEGSEG